MEKISKELIGASTIPIILSILSKKESYGYEIIKNVKDISDGKLAFKDGTLYPVLHKLEKRELIESYWKIAESGKKRKYYKICEKGEKELSSEKENWKIINQIISKLWKTEVNLTLREV
ncbi:MAG: PadR family transcriptional regulator [Psychroflexus sp.]